MRYPSFMRLHSLLLLVCAAALCPGQSPALHEDSDLDARLAALAEAHHGRVALYAHNLRTGQTASLAPDLPVKTASVIKMAILLDAAVQIRAGSATLDERLPLTAANQVQGSGVLGDLTPPLGLTLQDTLRLMVVLSDNTATNMAIERLGLEHINATSAAAGLRQTWLYKKVYVPATAPMPADQPRFGLGKTTPREMASLMERFASCDLPNSPVPSGKGLAPKQGAPQAQLAPPQAVCAAMLHMLRGQQDRDSLPRFIESFDTSEHGSAIANKTGALDQVRNDVALISTTAGPIVMAAFTFENADQRWTGDNEAEQTLGKLAQAVVQRWAPGGLDAQAFPWDHPGGTPAPQP